MTGIDYFEDLIQKRFKIYDWNTESNESNKKLR